MGSGCCLLDGAGAGSTSMDCSEDASGSHESSARLVGESDSDSPVNISTCQCGSESHKIVESEHAPIV